MNASDNDYAKLDALVSTLYNPAKQNVISTNIQQFLSSQDFD